MFIDVRRKYENQTFHDRSFDDCPVICPDILALHTKKKVKTPMNGTTLKSK